MKIHIIPSASHLDVLHQLLEACPGDLELEALCWQMPADQPPLTQLLAAYCGSRLVGATWARQLPGKLVRVWPPHVVTSVPESAADQLLTAISRLLVGQNGWLIQALLPGSALLPGNVGADADRLVRNGYRYVADLVVMSATCPQASATCPASPLRFVSYRDRRDRARLMGILEQTYQGTLDIPQLDGLRATDNVLEGYEQASHVTARVWLLVYDGKRAVGCLLLADQPERAAFELVYLGLIPESRGRGWGGHLVRHAQWRARQRGREKLLLAVDANNRPAREIYEAAGFAECGRHCLFLYPSGNKLVPQHI